MHASIGQSQSRLRKWEYISVRGSWVWLQSLQKCFYESPFICKNNISIKNAAFMLHFVKIVKITEVYCTCPVSYKFHCKRAVVINFYRWKVIFVAISKYIGERAGFRTGDPAFGLCLCIPPLAWWGFGRSEIRIGGQRPNPKSWPGGGGDKVDSGIGLKGLSHEIDFKNFDQNLKNLT